MHRVLRPWVCVRFTAGELEACKHLSSLDMETGLKPHHSWQLLSVSFGRIYKLYLRKIIIWRIIWHLNTVNCFDLWHSLYVLCKLYWLAAQIFYCSRPTATGQLIWSWLNLWRSFHTAWIHMKRRGPTPGRRRYRSCMNMAPKAATFPCMWWRRPKERLTNPTLSSAWKSEKSAAQVRDWPTCCCPPLEYGSLLIWLERSFVDHLEWALQLSTNYVSLLLHC